MLYGMGTVFVFLTLLVLCVLAMSKLLSLLPAEPIAESHSLSSEVGSTSVDPKVLAAIEAAIALHRNR